MSHSSAKLRLSSRKALLSIALTVFCRTAIAQDIHFAQYYAVPMLVSPANTGLMPEKDFRVAAGYRNQWAAVPVPYNTYYAYGDLQLLRGRSGGNSWFGIGAAVYQDKVGDGELTLNRSELMAAYHLLLGDASMISGGLSLAACQRSINFARLSFDEQWDGFSFSTSLPAGESGYLAKQGFADLGIGLNYAWFPNDRVYVKAGAGLSHLNQPVETFYGSRHRVGLRGSGTVDALFRLGENVIVNPSVYYTQQRNAWALSYGSLLQIAVNDGRSGNDGVIVGAYHRWGDAFIGVIGYEWRGSLRLLLSYDVNTSALAAQARGNGALELSLGYQGSYANPDRQRRTYNCPRF